MGKHVAMDLLVVVGTDQPPERLAASAHHILTLGSEKQPRPLSQRSVPESPAT
jgi:hypothetical protein